MFGLSDCRFEGILCLVKDKNREWIMERELRVRWKDWRGPQSLIIPNGFSTDLASIPAWAPLNPGGPETMAAVLHDYCYVTRPRLSDGTRMIRAYADALFGCAMESTGVSRLHRLAMWSAVRAGGWAIWNRRNDQFTEEESLNA